MIDQTNRKIHKPFRRLIFNADTTPIAGLFLVLMGFLLMAGRLCYYSELNNINLPESYGDGNITEPSFYTCAIYLTKDNKVYLDLDDHRIRKELLSKVGKVYNKKFKDVELENFAQSTFFGDDIRSFDLQKKNFNDFHNGIPKDQFSTWINCLNQIAPRYNFQLRADKELSYEEIKAVFSALQENGIHRIVLMTNLVQYKS